MGPMPRRRSLLVLSTALLCLSAVGCAPNDDNANSSGPTGSSPTDADACAHPPTVKAGVLTIATDSPAYDPWFSHNDPTNGKGFESAVAYAVAAKMGFPR